jgi:hypothetical protein
MHRKSTNTISARALVRRTLASLAVVGSLTVASSAAAQSAPPADQAAPPQPAQPPVAGQPAQYPPYGAPPGGVYYAPPPPGYGPSYAPQPDGPYVIEDWEEGDPIPDGYQPESRIRKGLVIGGAVTLGASWLVTVVITAAGQSIQAADDELVEAAGGDADADGRTADDWSVLYIPVAGPFVGVATLDASGGGLAVLLIDGVVQTGGLAMLIAGLAAQETRLVRIGDAEVRVAPVANAGEASLGLVGRF